MLKILSATLFYWLSIAMPIVASNSPPDLTVTLAILARHHLRRVPDFCRSKYLKHPEFCHVLGSSNPRSEPIKPNKRSSPQSKSQWYFKQNCRLLSDKPNRIKLCRIRY